MKLATLWARIGGGLIDLLIVLIISAVILFSWGFLVGLSGTENYLNTESQALQWKARGFLVGLIVDLFYTVGLQASDKQATYGQKIFKMQIVKSNGYKASAGSLMLRYIVSLFSSIFLKLGFLPAIFTKNRQTLHDLLAKTIVIKSEEENEIKLNIAPEIKNNKAETKNEFYLFLKILLLIVALVMVIAFLMSLFETDKKTKLINLSACKTCDEYGCQPKINMMKVIIDYPALSLIYFADGKEEAYSLSPPIENVNKFRCNIVKSNNFAFECNEENNINGRIYTNKYIYDGRTEFQQILDANGKVLSRTTCEAK